LRTRDSLIGDSGRGSAVFYLTCFSTGTPPGVGPNGERMDTPFYTVNYDFRLRLAGAAAAVKA
jgi:hypothetical protein